MAVQFIFGGSGRGKTYFLQHKIMEEAVKNPKKELYNDSSGTVYHADAERHD